MPNWPRSNLDGLVRFWPDASGPKVSRCARIVRPGSGRMQPANVIDLLQRYMSLQPFPLVALYFFVSVMHTSATYLLKQVHELFGEIHRFM